MTAVIIVVVALVVILAIALIVSYNRFVKQRNLIQESWRQIDVELHRRYDLIPNLVETVRAYAAHERHVFEEVARLRTQAVNVQGASPEQRAAAEGELSGALRQMMISVEAYPQLQSNQNFLNLQRELTDTEDRIAAGRRFFNANVGDYNTRIEAFPSNLIAGAFKFEKAGYFEVKDESVRAVPQVSFGTIGSVAGEQAPPQMAGGGQSSGQIHPQMPGDQGNYQQLPPQQQYPGQQYSGQQYQGQQQQAQPPYQGQPPVGGPPAAAPRPHDGQPPFTGA
ncbi:LemA family protein [Kribbella flavida DSM 17836]|uniref:LemA family protein n=1 Tax=Kribbella flavida (strain DSM 17836 / JCM 10339 / NBRC 14399) TaxID=479435 RepID=D2Q120_KRIFD|nr:LemA family protein [Kribbella flavida]ADB35721.1 LemA family protein [Kribbella flavida DSM 17836]